MVTSAEFWDKAARKYDRQTVKGPNYAARIERAAKWIGPDAVVLDAGCAGGQITLDLAGHVRHITGIDLSGKLIEYAEARRAEQGVSNADFNVATPEDDSLEPGTFDAVTAYSLLHLVEDQRKTLERFHELLKPGGVLILEVPTRETIRWPLRLVIRVLTAIGRAPVVRLYSQADHEAMLSKAGFEVREVRVYNPNSMNVSILACRS